MHCPSGADDRQRVAELEASELGILAVGPATVIKRQAAGEQDRHPDPDDAAPSHVLGVAVVATEIGPDGPRRGEEADHHLNHQREPGQGLVASACIRQREATPRQPR